MPGPMDLWTLLMSDMPFLGHLIAGNLGLMIWQIKWPKCLELDAQDKAQKGSNRLWQSVILHILLKKTARKRKTLFLPNGSII